jgi:hypothetical protein
MFCSEMNALAALAPPLDPSAADSGQARPACALLQRLAEAGMEMVEALVAQAKGAGPKVVEGDVALAFGRLSRAVRMAVLLQAELAGREAPEDAALKAEAERRAAHRDRAVRIVRRVARDHCRQEPHAVSAIAREAAERLDDDDIYGLVQTRPVGELVALICRDFGLQPDWNALAGEAWAKAEVARGARGSPFLEADDEEPDGPEEDPDPDAPAQVRLTRTVDGALEALARDPEIIAAARRDTG